MTKKRSVKRLLSRKRLEHSLAHLLPVPGSCSAVGCSSCCSAAGCSGCCSVNSNPCGSLRMVRTRIPSAERSAETSPAWIPLSVRQYLHAQAKILVKHPTYFHKILESLPSVRDSLTSSVAEPNPDPDPPDPHVFGPPGSGSGFLKSEVWIRIRLRIRILLSFSKNSKKNLDFLPSTSNVLDPQRS